MNPLDLWNWFSSDTGLMAVFAQNGLLGSCLIAGVIFIGTGVVVLPFLPGDSLLFGAGAYLGTLRAFAATGHCDRRLAAIAGDALNYSIGRSRVGQALARKGWIRPSHLARTREYFDRYGGMTITIARFVPVVRTVAPFLAGLSGMQAKRFFAYNVAGGVAWCAGMIFGGILAGQGELDSRAPAMAFAGHRRRLRRARRGAAAPAAARIETSFTHIGVEIAIPSRACLGGPCSGSGANLRIGGTNLSVHVNEQASTT